MEEEDVLGVVPYLLFSLVAPMPTGFGSPAAADSTAGVVVPPMVLFYL